MAVSESPQTIEFLREAARLLPTQNRTQLLLKSFYLSRASNYLASSAFRQLPDDGLACRKCCLPWKDQPFQMEIRPSISRKRRARKIVEQSEAKHSQLSRSHRILAKKYLKTANPIVQVTCPVCKTPKKTVLRQPIERTKGVTFPSKEPNSETQLNALAIDLTSVDLKKKRRKSDKSAGLIIPSNMIKSNTVKPALPIDSPKNVQPPAKPFPITPKPSVVPSKPKPGTPQLSASKKQGKSKKPAPKQISAAAQRSAAEKQRNNILMLANALKMGATNVASPLRGLQSMLRK